MEELVDVLSANGEVIGQATEQVVKEQRLLHRVAGVLVLNSDGQMLVHRRSMAADHGGKYAIMVCAVVKAGDTYVPTGARILREKLRIVEKGKSVNLYAIAPYRFTDAEANIDFGLFRCKYDGELKPNPLDIGEHFFASLDEIEKLMQEKSFLPSSVEIFKRYREAVRQ